MREGYSSLKLDEVVKLVVPDDVRSRANFRSLTQILGEYGYLRQRLNVTNSHFYRILRTSCRDISERKVTMLSETDTTKPVSSAFVPVMTLT